jgi:hypothetical protein
MARTPERRKLLEIVCLVFVSNEMELKSLKLTTFQKILVISAGTTTTAIIVIIKEINWEMNTKVLVAASIDEELICFMNVPDCSLHSRRNHIFWSHLCPITNT